MTALTTRHGYHRSGVRLAALDTAAPSCGKSEQEAADDGDELKEK